MTSAVVCCLLATQAAATPSVRDVLETYVRAPDASHALKPLRDVELPQGASAKVFELTSQTWQGLDWKHWLAVVKPARVDHPRHALLLIAGGDNGRELPKRTPGDLLLAGRIATETRSAMAIIWQVPNQPLFDDLHEDALISYTFERAMRTGDPTWPCLLPMTKSAVRAMDAVQKVGKEDLSLDIRHFVVTGASKRGWTTWLTGAVDPRVVAIAPMVIDVLNMADQMEHQVRSFGTYSEQIHDYTERNLQAQLSRPEGKALLGIVDPYSYRQKLTMPKLILLGTNDPYWPVDAASLYFGGLEGEKLVHYVPNEGHGVWPGAAPTVASFYHTILMGKPRPRPSWEYRADGKDTVLEIDPGPTDRPTRVELWAAQAPGRDFRKAVWSSSSIESSGGGKLVARIPRPAAGFTAVFGRLTYRSDLGAEWSLATVARVIGPQE